MSTKRAYGDPKFHIPGDPACSRCEEPSTPGNRVKLFTNEIGTKVFKHEKCQEKDETFNLAPVEAYIKRSSYPVLTCDNPHCGNEIDTGDENETDTHQVVGETCWACGKGNLSWAVSGQRLSSGMAGLEPTVPDYTNPYEDKGNPFGALSRYPKNNEPVAPMEQYGNNMDPNNDGRPPRNPTPTPPGSGSIPGKKANTYNDIRNHLIKGHGLREHWLQGYSPRLLLGIHHGNHTQSDVDHSH